jgi:hypothetical protein
MERQKRVERKRKKLAKTVLVYSARTGSSSVKTYQKDSGNSAFAIWNN